MVSGLLTYSNLMPEEYVIYHTEEIRYKYNTYLGCKSDNFLPKGWKLITLERLFQSVYGESLNKSVYSIREYSDRIRFLTEQTIRITGLEDFGIYICKLLTINALIDGVKAKTFCKDFDEQLDLVEQIYGQHIHFAYTEKDIDGLLTDEPYYPQEIKQRVKEILMRQRRKYQYLFAG